MAETEETNNSIMKQLEMAVDDLHSRNFNRAISLAQGVLHTAKSSANHKMYSYAQNVLGVTYAALGNETMAVDCYLDGLQYAIDYEFHDLISLFYNNIGTRYQELNDHSTALEYFLKAEKELDDESCKKDPHYNAWKLVSCLNILVSCSHLGNYSLGERYLALANEFLTPASLASGIDISVLVIKCQFYWHTGRKQYVYDKLDTLVKECPRTLGSDFIQNMQEMCALFIDIKDYDRLYKVLCIFNDYADSQNSLYFKLTVCEYWLKYYELIHDTANYSAMCIKHTELYRKHKIIHNMERIDAINQKIMLQEKEIERRQAEFQSKTDALTGLGNRYLLDSDFKYQMHKIADSDTLLCLAIIDIDFFKLHNDVYGHIHGDECLKSVAALLKSCVGAKGHVYRFGGDEFVILFSPDTMDDISVLANNIKEKLSQEPLQDKLNNDTRITLSQGYACGSSKTIKNKNAFLAKADQALYFVKEHGKNDFVVYEC